MPTIGLYILATFFIVISVSSIILTLRITRATLRQRQLATDIGGGYCSLGVAGCSIICSRIRDVDQITELLSTEHDRYEVIAVLDADLYTEQIEQIIRHFKMIRVNTPCNTELPHTHIRTLYRSRLRCFRRLILIDQGFISSYDDLNAASVVASYDYIIPLVAPFTLRSDAIDNIIIALTEHSQTDIDAIYSIADRGAVFHRDAIVDADGFTPDSQNKIAYNRSLTVAFPILRSTTRLSSAELIYLASAATIIIAVCYISFGPLLALIALLCAAVIVTCARYSAQIIDGGYSYHAILYHIIDIRRFFCRRKLLVS